MPRPAAVPLRSNLVTGRAAQRSTTPPLVDRANTLEFFDHEGTLIAEADWPAAGVRPHGSGSTSQTELSPMS